MRHFLWSINKWGLSLFSMLVAVAVLSDCSDSGGIGALVARWVSGADVGGQHGVYGTRGTASPSNVPGERVGAVSWADSKGHLGHLWLFGGYGADSVNQVLVTLSDLWSFDGTNWTWVSGSDVGNQIGVYGTQSMVDPSNMPGARCCSVSWIDGFGNLWLFGGGGYDSAGNYGYLNDLWKFDGSQWTWVNGSDVINQKGVYGTEGMADPSNVPGARVNAISWTDSHGNFWLFGGGGYDSAGNQANLNDLWKYDGSQWTWVSGAELGDQYGVYGSQGSASPSNVPGARQYAVSWVDSQGELWLFGGLGFSSTTLGLLNDLWKFDGTNWTWISGADIDGQTGGYGTKGTASPSNVPGARQSAVSWMDFSGDLWLFGGYGLGSTTNFVGQLNDLWRFDGSQWTWVSGANAIGQKGNYGRKGTASPSNMPGARQSAVSWMDFSGNLWLFGGSGIDSTGTSGYLNDLWELTP